MRKDLEVFGIFLS